MLKNLAPRDGFEPPLPGSEPGVLPLDDQGVEGRTLIRDPPTEVDEFIEGTPQREPPDPLRNIPLVLYSVYIDVSGLF